MVKRYQRDNQNPPIEEGQTKQWLKKQADLLRLVDFDYPFGIFKLFFHKPHTSKLYDIMIGNNL
jgi:hypothetical protein